jgi:hypothetical protein
MLFKLLTYSGLLFTGLSRKDFCNTRNKKDLRGLVEIHHIIPQEFRYHPTIIVSNYNIENGYNLMFLPTSNGGVQLNIHKDRPIHHHGHIKYNKYIEKTLDDMFREQKTNEYNLCKLNKELKQNLRHCDIPWT